MSDEGLDYIIGVVVDGVDQVQPALEKVESLVTGSVDKVNTTLEKLGNVEVLRGLLQGADATVLSLKEINEATAQAIALQRVLSETARDAQAGTGSRITGIGGFSRAEIDEQVAALRQLQAARREVMGNAGILGEKLLTQGQVADVETLRAALEGVGFSAKDIKAAIASLTNEGFLTITRGAQNAQEAVLKLEAQLAELRAEEASAAGLDPLAPFRGEGGSVNFTAAAARQASLNSSVATARLTRVADTEEPDPEALAKAEASAIGAASAEERKNQALGAQGTLYDRIAGLQEQLVGLSDKEAQATLAVLAAKSRIAEANEAGVVSGTQLISLARQLEAAESRLLATREKEAEAAARTAAGAGGGGGFISNAAHGFFGGGFGGGEGRGPVEEAGFQLGLVAQYTLYYQIFREIEDAIGASVGEALQFDRAVTDMSNRLEISRDAARGLADQVGQLGAIGGLGPAETIGYATSYAGVFQGQAPQTELLTQGAQTAAQIQVLTGNLKDDMPDVISTVQAFNMTFSDTQRVLDAATSAAQNYGLANASAVLPGLAQIGDLAAQSGMSLEQTANLIADVSTRTNDSSEAVAGELQRFLGRTGTPAFQAVFSNLGITGTDFNAQLSKLSERFESLSDSQKRFITSEFGGGRAGVAALAYIEDYNKILDNTTKSLDDGGIAQKNYAQRLADIVGVITSIRGELKELAKDFGTSGIGAGFGIALQTLKPFVELLDEAVRLLNEITSIGGINIGGANVGKDFQSLVYGGVEIAGLYKVLQSTNIGDRVKGLFGGSKDSAVESAESAAETRTSVAADSVTRAFDELVASIDRAIAAFDGDTTATEANTASKVEDTAVTTTEAAVKLDDAAATTADTASKLRDAVAGAASTIGLATSSVLARIPLFGRLGTGGQIAAALGGAILTQQIYDAEKSVVSGLDGAEAASQDAYSVNPADANALQDKAQFLRQSAQTAESSSGGFWHSIENYVGAGEGRIGGLGRAIGLDHVPVIGHLFNVNPETTGDAASLDRVQAGLLSLESQRSQAAQESAHSAGDFSSLIDLTKQGGVTDGLKALAAQGLDSGQQLDTLNEKLAAFAQAANGAGSYIAAGTASLVAQTYANAAINNLVQSGGKFGSKDFQKNLAPGLNAAIESVAEQFLGPIQGSDFTSQNGRDLEGQVQSKITEYLKNNGFSGDDLKDAASSIHGAAGAAVQQAIAQANASHGQKIGADAVGGVAAALPQLISGTVQNVTTLAQLGQVAAPHGTQVAGLRAALEKAQNTYDSLKASGADATTLQGITDELNGLKVQLNEAVLANIDAQAQLAAASIPPENTTAQIEAQIADFKAQLAAASNPDDILKLRTELRKAEAQLAASEAQDRISRIGINDNPGDAVLVAKDALAKAQAQVDDDRKRGVKGAALNNARAQLTQAQYAYAQAVLQEQNSATLAGARAGDPLSTARAQLEAAANTLASDIVGTTKYYQDLASVNQAQASLAQAIAQGAATQYLLHGDTTDPIAQALATLKGARTQLSADRKNGTGSLSNDRLSVEQAEQAAQRARFDQRLKDQQTAYDLNRESAGQYLNFLDRQHDVLVHQLAGMKKGTQGYRQLVDELNTIDEAIHSVDGQLAGQFNLGDIRTPTVYQVRESLTPGGTLGPTRRNEVTVTVVDKTEGGVKAKAVLDNSLGDGTVSRTGVLPRKVRR